MGQVAVASSVSAAFFAFRSRFRVAAWTVSSSVSPEQKDPNALGTQRSQSATLPHSATHLISVFKVALALPIYCNPRANRSSQTQIRYLYNYCRLVVPICHIPAAFLTPLS